MATISHKALTGVSNAGSNSGIKQVWAQILVCLAAGYKLAGSGLNGRAKSTSTDPAQMQWLNSVGTIGTSNSSGSGAVIAAPARGRALVTGLSGLTSAHKGMYLKITGSSVSANNNVHQIEEIVSATSCKIDARTFAVGADAVGRSWDIRDLLGESYNGAAITANTGWVCLVGPAVLQIPITTDLAMLPGERITQAATGFEGVLDSWVYHAANASNYAKVYPQVRGTGAGQYGLDTSTIVGEQSGASFTPGTAKEFRIEVVWWKGASGLIGSIFVGQFDVVADAATRFSALVASAGCSATVAPGGGGAGNSFPARGMLCMGSTGSASGNWLGISTFTASTHWALCADAIEESRLCADGSFSASTLISNGTLKYTWQSTAHMLHRVVGGPPGDLFDRAWFGPGDTTAADTRTAWTAPSADAVPDNYGIGQVRSWHRFGLVGEDFITTTYWDPFSNILYAPPWWVPTYDVFVPALVQAEFRYALPLVHVGSTRRASKGASPWLVFGNDETLGSIRGFARLVHAGSPPYAVYVGPFPSSAVSPQ
jgi:hypothetical protein